MKSKLTYFLISLLLIKVSVSSNNLQFFRDTCYTYKIVQLPHKTYGYTISYNQKKIISQNVVPGCEGNYGFEKRKDCKRVAQLVCKKLTNNNLPTISEEDLLSLNIKCK